MPVPQVKFCGIDGRNLRGRSHLSKTVRSFLQVHSDAHELLLELVEVQDRRVLRLVVREKNGEIIDVLEFNHNLESASKFFAMNGVTVPEVSP